MSVSCQPSSSYWLTSTVLPIVLGHVFIVTLFYFDISRQIFHSEMLNAEANFKYIVGKSAWSDQMNWIGVIEFVNIY